MLNFGYGAELGPLDSKHLEQIRLWRNCPVIYKWCRQWEPIADVTHASWFKRQSEDPSTKMYGVFTGPDLIGVSGLTSIDHINDRAEFSLYISPENHKAGYGKAALKTLVRHGFDNMGLNSIWGECFDGNPASKMFESVGFKKDGIRREFYFREGRFVDAHLYSLLRSQWIR